MGSAVRANGGREKNDIAVKQKSFVGNNKEWSSMKSNATTVAEYLAALPEDRRNTIEKVRTVIRKSLPKGYEEMMNWGAITYAVPLTKLPKTYNGQPLCYVALAAQKNYNALYLMQVYGDVKKATKLKNAFKAAGKKLDMGKSCLRFQSIDDLPVGVIAEIISSTPIDEYVAIYEKSRQRTPRSRAQA